MLFRGVIPIKTKEEIELMRLSNQLVAKTHAELAKVIKPGMKTIDLDTIAEQFIRDHNGKPAFKGYGGFPCSLCISENHKVVHGIPGDYIIKEGDVVSIDCGVELNGFFGDSAFTYPIGEIDTEVKELLDATIISLYLGIEQAVVGNRIGDISFAIQDYTEKKCGYGVVRELVGHGIGESLHEKPEVPNYGKRGKGVKLKSGMCLAIEPMINLGTRKVKELDDRWTIVTVDSKFSAHYEHTIAITEQGPDILSDFEVIHEALKSNANVADFDEKMRYLQTNFKNG